MYLINTLFICIKQTSKKASPETAIQMCSLKIRAPRQKNYSELNIFSSAENAFILAE